MVFTFKTNSCNFEAKTKAVVDSILSSTFFLGLGLELELGLGLGLELGLELVFTICTKMHPRAKEDIPLS